MKFNSGDTSADDATAYLKGLYEISLKERNLPEADAQMQVLQFGIVMQEMTTNAVHHGNRDNPKKFMWLTFAENADGIQITISDESGVFFDGLDPNERVNQLGLRVRSEDEASDTDGLIARRLAAGHAVEREGHGGRGIFLSQQLGAQVKFLPHRDEAGGLVGTTVELRFPRAKL